MDSRRNFLGKVASGLGTLAAVPARVFGANDRIRVGFIGFGDRATDLLNHIRACPNTETVAFCDVFSTRLDRARSLAPSAAVYADHRQMLEDASIDAVVIATPPHLHAAHFCDALDAEKHVYQEKTMAFTVDDAKRMRAAFRAATAAGTRSRSGTRRAPPGICATFRCFYPSPRASARSPLSGCACSATHRAASRKGRERCASPRM